MKRLLPIIILSIAFITSSYAQKAKTDFGKIDKSELEKNYYEPDTTANAVILSHKVVSFYKYIGNEFKIYTDNYIRIKILTPEGVDKANVTLPYYVGKRSADFTTRITQIKANSYNLSNNKIEKTEMEKKYIFDEQIADNWKQIKFSIPSVKAGTVIEYQYQLQSDFYYQIPDMEMQFDIPVIKGYYEITIPYIYDFNISYKKNFPIKIEEKVVKQKIVGEGNQKHSESHVIMLDARKATFETTHIPALKDEPYSWCKDDFKASAGFELQGIKMPGREYQPYTTTWEKIDEELLKDEDFGALLSMENPYREDIRFIDLSSYPLKQDRAELAFEILKKNMEWDGKYRLYSLGIDKAIKKGSGNNAELNFILMSILRDMGVKSHPIVLSLRERGRLHMIFPTKTKLNTFIIGAEMEDGSLIYLDASMDKDNISILPTRFMVEQARLINSRDGSKWLDLTKAGKNTVTIHWETSLNREAILEGKYTSKRQGQFAAEYRIQNSSTTEEIKRKLENRLEMEIREFEVKGLKEPFESITEKYLFEKKVDSNNEYIYLNPMIFAHLSANPFQQEQRNLPIELNYPYQFRIITSINIGDEYEIEELPKSSKFIFEENEIECTYSTIKKENGIQFNYLFNLNKIIFPEDIYKELSEYYANVVQKNKEMIILKKKNSN